MAFPDSIQPEQVNDNRHRRVTPAYPLRVGITAAAAVYAKYKEPFLTRIKGAQTERLLIRPEDVQVSCMALEKPNTHRLISRAVFFPMIW